MPPRVKKMSSRTAAKTRQTHKQWQRHEQQTRPDKPIGNGNGMNSRQAMDSHESRACTRLRHHPLIPSHYRHGGPWVRGKRDYGLTVRRRGSLFYDSHSSFFFFWEMSCRDNIPPKRGKAMLESLDACHRN